MLPQNMDVFTWSLPFVFEKVQEMLECIVKKCASMDDDKDNTEDVNPVVKKMKINMRTVIQHKITFISKMTSMLTRQRMKHESLIKIKGMCPDKLIPDEMIEECSVQIKDS